MGKDGSGTGEELDKLELDKLDKGVRGGNGDACTEHKI